MIVYLDVVLMENLFMNYIILFATAIINKVEIKLIRILLASIIGSLYAVANYTSILENKLGLILKIFLSIAMVYLAFKPKTFKQCIKQLLIFYLTSFTFGGVAFALLYFIKPGELLMKNGVYIGTYPLKIALMGGIVGFVIVTIAFKIIKGKISKKDIFCQITIQIEEQSKTLIAMLDTGNQLKEPLTGAPVVIVEKEELKELIPEQIIANSKKIIEGNIEEITQIEKFQNRFRVLPFNSIGKTNGLLLGIKADKVTVKYDTQEITLNNIILGVYDENLSKNNSYHALIGLDMLEERGCPNEYFRNVKV